MQPLSIRRAYTGRKVLLTGATGFLGKVWLVMMLDRCPGIGKIYVLLRRKALLSARDRFEKMIATSPAFAPLHERHGEALGEYIARRVEIIEGDVSLPGLGLDEAVAKDVRGGLDLVIHCAGLVDFDPDIREAVSINVDGTAHMADFVEGCARARLLHVSTCYVTGTRPGTIAETLLPGFSPEGPPLDIEAERAELAAEIQATLERIEEPARAVEHEARARKQIRKRGLAEDNPMLLRNITRRIKKQELKDALIEVGQRRAYARGWPNIYTYSKSLAESLLATRRGRFQFSILRPAIVESAAEYPFPGWNQGFNTCGPVTYILGSWFRHLPARNGNPFDIIPVDYVCKAITIAGAALLRGDAEEVYQCGTSDVNLLTIDRACELTALAHRRHLRERGNSPIERVLLSRWDAVPTDEEHLLSVPNISAVARGFSKLLRGLPKKLPSGVHEGAERWAKKADEVRDKLSTIDRMLTLYLPFIYENHFVFVTEHLRAREVVEEEFRFAPQALDWRRYWLDVHMPGLRKWCYPLYEGKTPERYTPAAPFKLPASDRRDSPPSSQPPRARPTPVAAAARVRGEVG